MWSSIDGGLHLLRCPRFPCVHRAPVRRICEEGVSCRVMEGETSRAHIVTICVRWEKLWRELKPSSIRCPPVRLLLMTLQVAAMLFILNS